VVGRIAAYRPQARITDAWRSFAAALDVSDEERAALLDPDRVYDACVALPDQRTAKLAHACTHMTFSPNVVHGGVKTNVIPDVVDIDVDIRLLPGETPDDVTANLAAAIGDLASAVEVTTLQAALPTASPFDSRLREVLEIVVRRTYPNASLVPRLTTGGTDLRFFRDKGAVSYGFGLFSEGVTFEDFAGRFHGNDERVDVESLRLTTDMWVDVVRELIG
jgi:acetylornithine deacetylase/succinyl-diaminopimelate desuccinylase-like protein